MNTSIRMNFLKIQKSWEIIRIVVLNSCNEVLLTSLFQVAWIRSSQSFVSWAVKSCFSTPRKWHVDSILGVLPHKKHYYILSIHNITYYKRKTAVVPDLRVMIDLEGPLSNFSTFAYRGSSHRRKSTAWHLIYMVWLYRSLSQWVGRGILLDPLPLPLRRQLTKSYMALSLSSLLV